MTLKKSKLKDNYIPIILGVVGVVVGVAYCGIFEGWSVEGILSGIVQGVLMAGCSVYVNQIIKQLLKDNNVSEEVANHVADTIVPNKEGEQ